MNEEDAVRAWRQILAMHAAAACALERELSERHRLGMSEFEVLERMVEGGREKYRVQEVADAVHLSQSACSRLLARLEKAGLVTRAVCQDDRRGIYVGITGQGRERHATALPTHRAVIGEIFAPVDPGTCRPSGRARLSEETQDAWDAGSAEVTGGRCSAPRLPGPRAGEASTPGDAWDAQNTEDTEDTEDTGDATAPRLEEAEGPASREATVRR
ncbi:MarR family winged helix-turn-helix transcriptional regulator [Streptosporangium sp. NPDC050855]|uniref:MarR family winged helix-turn-helix transcriptional regulator n=1 Tax=Streptosporangium sp. NPDC050855 TaxID=3366194 RepID=UPI00379123DB